MGGKTATSSSQLQIPPEVMAQYRAVNTRAEQAAAQPFQAYSNNPDAFVAPLTQTQQAAIGNINNAQGMATPYFNAATQSIAGGQAAADPLQASAQRGIGQAQGLGLAGTQQALRTGNQYTGAATNMIPGAMRAGQSYLDPATSMIPGAMRAGQSYLDPATSMTMGSGRAVDPTGLGAAQIGQFMSPYNEGVVQSTMANLRQQQGQEQSSLQGDQIMRGSFGGSRADLGRANLARQQDLASGQVLSGLYNQNYSQALGAAQQQQGLNLGAQQANRAALGQAGQQMAGLGQQAYSQQMGGASALQGLGAQAYSQQMGGASALQGLGAQAYGQQSGAANQMYNQGIGAAGANAQLGQQVYGQGMQTSQALSGIGQGAQAATLAGAQAQLGAGTAEQQTQQAGTQGLYNQFLQQQGYPFQVAQFLGNIAMGTGALSGSTTVGQTPMPFFSDKRLKEHAVRIGKTFDGQNIYKYKYKGSPNTQIGLMAQEVEKKRPEAVGEALGFKTVDYDKATKKSERKARAEGGQIGDPAAMEEILRMHQAMYPFGAEGAGRTGGGTGPHGMQLSKSGNFRLQEHAKLPQAQAQVSMKDLESVAGLGKVAYDKFSHGDDMAAGRESARDAAHEALGMADAGNASALDETMSGIANEALDLSIDDADFAFARGGLATHPGGYSAGGLPYGADGYVPVDDDEKKHEMLKGPELPKSQDKGAGGDIMDAAKIAMMFMNRGGRAGYKFGGDPSEEDSELPPLGDDIEVGPVPGFRPEALGASAAPQPETERLVAAPPMDAPAPGMSGLGAAAKAPSGEKTGLAIPVKDPPIKELDTHPYTPPSRERGGNWIERHQNWLIPMLKGVGAMASSPSRFLGAALLQGVGAGAQSYQDMQKQEMEYGVPGGQPGYKGQELGLRGGDLGLRGTGQNLQKLQIEQKNRAQALELLRYYTTNVTGPFIGADGKRFYRDKTTQQVMSAEEVDQKVSRARDLVETAFFNDKSKAGGPSAPPAGGAPAPSGAMPSPGGSAPRPQPSARPASPQQPQAAAQPSGPATSSWRNVDASGLPPMQNPYKLLELSNSTRAQGLASPDAPDSQSKIQLADSYREQANAIINGDQLPVDKNGQPFTGFQDVARMRKQYSEESAKRTAAQDEIAAGSMRQARILAEMRHHIAEIPDSGWLTSGSGNDFRRDLAKKINTFSSITGGQPLFNENQMASGELLTKDNFRLGQQLGGHSAGFIVDQAIGATPSLENTKEGYARLLSSLEQTAQYEQDYRDFLNQFRASHGGLLIDDAGRSADSYFQEKYPPQKYVEKAIIDSFAPKHVQWLKENGRKAVRAFEQKYGSGTANLALRAANE